MQEIQSSAARVAEVVDVEKVVATVVEQALLQLRAKVADATEDDPSDLVFAIMSFAPDMDPTFDAIESAARTVGLKAERVKDVPGDYRITDRILDSIRTPVCQGDVRQLR